MNSILKTFKNLTFFYTMKNFPLFGGEFHDSNDFDVIHDSHDSVEIHDTVVGHRDTVVEHCDTVVNKSAAGHKTQQNNNFDHNIAPF